MLPLRKDVSHVRGDRVTPVQARAVPARQLAVDREDLREEIGAAELPGLDVLGVTGIDVGADLRRFGMEGHAVEVGGDARGARASTIRSAPARRQRQRAEETGHRQPCSNSSAHEPPP